ncbi:MAG: SDR family NAD(P)-dependent oxidoreductase [Deltaproteobacteria bacterium]|nr:SDR family NAD(P)-dependent oxidoreductase [Deltaproteobacteria bacterium]MBW2533212.1 SDR family NAD(P)-dependent oxidoreductase [Deltaproteobacteria bacterium]
MLKLYGETPLSALLIGIRDQLRRPARGVALADGDLLDGATCLVTGANSGLGKAVATELARRGARLILACRSGIPEAGEQIRRESGNDAVEMVPVDLSDLDSVRALGDGLAERAEKIDVVIANAGIVPRRSSRTAQGFELMFGVNYLAHAMMIRRLLRDGLIRNSVFSTDGEPTAEARRLPRIVIVSSQLHRSARPIDFATFGRYVDYGLVRGLRQYGHTKLLLCTLAQELARRLAPAGEVQVAVHSLCPGGVATNIARDVPPPLKPAADWVMQRLLASPERAAGPVVYLACAREIEGRTGCYLHMTQPKPPSAEACDRDQGRRLWRATEALLAPFERD